MKISILTIGDEILIGQVVDTNSAWIGSQVNSVGGQVIKILSGSDNEDTLLQDLNFLASISDLVLITGGLGPTKDDRTKLALATFFEMPLAFSEASYNSLQRKFAKRNIPLSPRHRDQCYLPAKATLLENKVGTAPGMLFEKNNTLFVSMPGVPFEMKYIMEHWVLPMIEKKMGSNHVTHETLTVVGLGESQIADMVQPVEDTLPTGISLAYLPNFGVVRLRLSTNSSKNEDKLLPYLEKLEAILKDAVLGRGAETLEEKLAKASINKNVTIGTAESCTGGYIAHKITKNAGASQYFSGSVVSYSNAVKQEALGVREETLLEHGAVSEACVIEMARGARIALGVDFAVSVSGIAGPEGGTPEKPVGTIWLAVASKDKIETTKLQLGKNRWKNIQYTANVALYKLFQAITKW